MFSAGAGVFFPGAGVFFAGAGAGGEKPGVCTALMSLNYEGKGPPLGINVSEWLDFCIYSNKDLKSVGISDPLLVRQI